ncbi:Ig-like domain-containing protein [Actinophytocola sp. NPDC049390]|uniref:L,D-transpeptidase n=1 Tax=Actinophytocola sp. NPDC049390 TaxID=3363894 RepID=UPI003790BD12
MPEDAAEKVSPIEPIEVRAGNAKLDSVSVTNPQGKQVTGALSADKTRWTSTEPLGYGRQYTVRAVARSADGKETRKTVSFTTLRPDQTVFPSFFPPPSITTVGVGQPIAVIFDKPPADRAAAERALKVTATPATEGGWYWWDDRTVHWRPKEYWRPGTKVTVEAKIYGVKLGDGMYGETDRTLNLTIGPAKIATIDDRTKKMTVTVNGKTVHTFPVSMGRPDSVTVNGKKISFITPSGTYVAQEKYKVKQMSSATYGLPSDAALGYDSRIPLAVRLSNSGIFVHAAPWSVADQGVRNVSHGCINLSPEAGRWFYDNFGYGDVVTVSNTSTRLEPTDGFGDWNIPWEEWLEGSALR